MTEDIIPVQLQKKMKRGEIQKNTDGGGTLSHSDRK